MALSPYLDSYYLNGVTSEDDQVGGARVSVDPQSP